MFNKGKKGSVSLGTSKEKVALKSLETTYGITFARVGRGKQVENP